jgi:GT2 family glycosyltransferase
MVSSVPRIAVVTVTYNSAQVLPDFLNSVDAQTFRNFVLVVVDNASADESVELVAARASSNMEIIPNSQNLGVAEGNNQGIRRAFELACTHVLLLNNDTVFGPHLFQTLVATGGEHPVVVPKIYFHDFPEVLWYAGGIFNRSRGYSTAHVGEGARDVGQYDESQEVTYSPTCCMLIEMSVFRAIGMMDARYFVYGDDADFCFRLWRSGRSIWYTSDAVMNHKVGSLTGGGESSFSARMGARNRVYFWRKHLSWVSATYFLTIYFLYFVARFLVRRDSWGRFLLKVRALREGLHVASVPPLAL